MLLLKPAGRMPHGGGRLLTAESEPYELPREWIVQGMPIGDSPAPTLRGLELVPARRVLDRRSRQQSAVLARRSDGSTRDLTRRARFQGNETDVAAIEPDGLVRSIKQAGEAAVMARYLLWSVFHGLTAVAALKRQQPPAAPVRTTASTTASGQNAPAWRPARGSPAAR